MKGTRSDEVVVGLFLAGALGLALIGSAAAICDSTFCRLEVREWR